MKRIIRAAALAAVIVSICAAGCFAASDGFMYKATTRGGATVTRFYSGGAYAGKLKTKKALPVKVMRSARVTSARLTHRKNRYILVEKISGVCLNSAGDGKTSDGYYISYKRVKGHKRGAKYTTYCVYANNNSIDDISIRIDIRG